LKIILQKIKGVTDSTSLSHNIHKKGEKDGSEMNGQKSSRQRDMILAIFLKVAHTPSLGTQPLTYKIA